MKALHQILIALLLALTAPCFAAPRVAIITPITGQIELAGTLLKGPRIAEEGQILTLSNNAEVRIQLLGSNKEKIVKSVPSYTIRRETIEKEGKAISRGNLSITGELAGLSRAAAFTTRSQNDYGRIDPDGKFIPLGIGLSLPPSMGENGSWEIPVSFSQNFTPTPENTVIVTVADTADYRSSWEVTIDAQTPSLEFPPHTLVSGHRYQVRISNKKGGYIRYFYALSNEERDAISAQGERLHQEAKTGEQLPALLHLASFYQSVDDTEKVSSVLQEAIEDSKFKELDDQSQAKILELLNEARQQLDLAPYKS